MVLPNYRKEREGDKRPPLHKLFEEGVILAAEVAG